MKSTRAWKDRTVGVLGLGRSGRAATRLLARAGARVYASDIADTESLRRETAALAGEGVEIELGRHDRERLRRCDLLVVSPGIPPTADIFQDPDVGSRPIISEVELAFEFLDAPVIAVTGTNGKTTTTAWIGSILAEGGVKVGVGGNIGRALSELAAAEHGYDWVVVEVSSFQLAGIERFRPAIGVLLNLRPDHLDRYSDVERYYADKARLFDNADASSCWVLNGEDTEVRQMGRGRPGTARHFRVATPLESHEEGGYVSPGGELALRCGGEKVGLVRRDELRPLGDHSVANALAAAVTASFVPVPVEGVRRALRKFEPLPHRLQPVGVSDGVLWIDDSKATNVASTRVALRAMNRPTVLLLGGRGKGESFEELRPELTDRVRMVVAYGEAAPEIESQLSGLVPLQRVDAPFTEVIRTAREHARPGDVVLLAPACASFDMFRDYEQRGERFVQLVKGAEG